MRTLPTLCATATLAVLSACATSRDIEGTLGLGCVTCHGGMEGDLSGAPPFDVQGLTSSAAVGAHQRHLGKGVACASCHRDVDLARREFPGHRDGVVDVVFAAVAFDPAGGTTPAYDRATHACSNVSCHAPSRAPGGSLPAPRWDAPPGAITGCTACHAATPGSHSGIGGRACRECHATTFEPGSSTSVAGPAAGGAHGDGAISLRAHADPGWAVTGAAGVTPHGLAANYRSLAAYPTGLAGCRGCHGANLVDGVVAGIPSCDSCHQPYALPGTSGADWRRDCTFCHGDRARLADGLDVAGATTLAIAPPRDSAGQVSGAEVGAHAAHLYATSGRSGGVACSACHGGMPGDFVHVNGSTAVSTLRNPAGASSGTYSAATQTCAASYCHGNFTNGKTGNTPSWTGAGSQTCTSCHDGPPATGRHPSAFDKHSWMHQDCVYCHYDVANVVPNDTVGTFSTIKASGRGLHVNGAKNVALTNMSGTTVQGTSGSYVKGWDATARSCNPGCHGTESW